MRAMCVLPLLVFGLFLLFSQLLTCRHGDRHGGSNSEIDQLQSVPRQWWRGSVRVLDNILETITLLTH